MDNPKILFMGTPDFAKTALQALVSGGYNVTAVLTQPDKPKGRGYILTPSPVKEYALQMNIPVFQPKTLKDGAFAEELESLCPELMIVAAYGKLLPSHVLNYPRLGCINIHGSLLPEYRGAAPIQRAIIDGKAETGVTLMRMDDGLDTGDMLTRVSVPISDDDNFATLHDKMAEAGASLLLSSLPAIIDGTITRTAQDGSLASYASKIENQDCILDFSHSAPSLFNRIRGLSPFPMAFALQNGAVLKIPAARVGKPAGICGTPGEVLSLADGEIEIACGSGTLLITEVLPAGKKRMKASDYINGRKIQVSDRLETPILPAK